MKPPAHYLIHEPTGGAYFLEGPPEAPVLCYAPLLVAGGADWDADGELEDQDDPFAVAMIARLQALQA